jgi:membrane protein involved in colicin uptake
MKTKIGRAFVILSMLGLLVSCAQTSPLEGVSADRMTDGNIGIHGDHDRLAEQYQRMAKELRIKAEEQRKLLEQYEEKSYLYGKQAQDRQSHMQALARKYQRVAEEAIRQAAFHQKMAAELARCDHDALAGTSHSSRNQCKTGRSL